MGRASADGDTGRNQHPAREANIEWKNMSAEARKVYEMQATRLKAAYAEQLSDYRELG